MANPKAGADSANLDRVVLGYLRNKGYNVRLATKTLLTRPSFAFDSEHLMPFATIQVSHPQKTTRLAMRFRYHLSWRRPPTRTLPRVLQSHIEGQQSAFIFKPPLTICFSLNSWIASSLDQYKVFLNFVMCPLFSSLLCLSLLGDAVYFHCLCLFLHIVWL